jgi:hypothetical protein
MIAALNVVHESAGLGSSLTLHLKQILEQQLCKVGLTS